MTNTAKYPDANPAATSHPLWPMTVILGDIAQRLERQRASEQVERSPETRCAAGSDPLASGEAA